MDTTITRLGRLVSFGLLISITSSLTRKFCGGLESSAAHIPLRPPSWVFGLVWSALFVTTGLAWANASAGELDALLAAVTVLSCAWLVVYSCLGWKKAASGVLVATWATALAAAGRAKSPTSRWLIAPLVAWTAFASYLNGYDAFGPAK